MSTELQERRGRLVAQAREALEEIKSNTDESRAAELEARHDTIMAEYDALEKLMQREARTRRLEEATQAGDDRRPMGADQRAAGRDDGNRRDAALDYRTAFAKIVSGWSHDDLEPHERAALRARSGVSPELRVQVAGTGSAGGHAVPTELMREIDIALVEGGPMWDPAVIRELRTASGHTMTMPTIDDTASTAEAHTEGAEVTNDGGKDVVLGQKSLEAYAYDTEWLRWSWILEQDSIFSFESILGQLLGERLSRIANAKLTVGTGTNEPNGIVTAAGLGKTCTSTTAVTADEIIEFVHSINPAYRRAPKFAAQFNDATLLVLRKLRDGDGNYLITEAPDGSGRLRVGAVSLPYHVNPDMANLGAGNRFMIAGDFGRYLVRKVNDATLFVAREKFAPQLGILGLIRFDGELANAGAVKAMRNATS